VAPRRDGLAGVADQVQDKLVQLRGIDLGKLLRWLGGQLQARAALLDGDPLAIDDVAHDRDDVVLVGMELGRHARR